MTCGRSNFLRKYKMIQSEDKPKTTKKKKKRIFKRKNYKQMKMSKTERVCQMCNF